MLYDVPQTSDASEAAMVSLIARLRASCPKPEALAPISDTALALMAAEWIGRIGSALGDRVTGPILQWDGALDGACRKLTARDAYNTRGRDRQSKGDAGIDAVADDALAYLARLRSPDREEQPRFVCADSTPQDAPLVHTEKSAGAWTRASRERRGHPWL